jgi:hypothetical protein
MRSLLFLVLSAILCWSAPALAGEPIGQVKKLSGNVAAVQGGATKKLSLGDRVYEGNVIVTDADGAIGITFSDNSMLSLGPSSELVLHRFRFNTTTHKGAFDAWLRKGTLVGKSGQIVKETPQAMTVKTPTFALLVKGTTFAVRADGEQR